ncbi:MAG: hypothetical protein H6739_19160 [Alphaproteobacteria bacterium]|nr:hypothetical protein [Alphaproteobacteria bacterium]
MSADALRAALSGVEGLTLRPAEPFTRHTELRVGGPAELFAVAETEDAVLAAAQAAKEHGVKLHGLEGLQLVVKGAGAPGLWLRPGACAEGIADDGAEVRVGARHPAAALASWAVRHEITGFEPLGGRAGTVAEALRAGALKEAPVQVRALRGARLADLDPDKLREHHLLLSVTFARRGGRLRQVRGATEKAADKRRGTGPGLPGQLMKDPGHGDTAAELMADAGLCGVRLRAARLGVKEPNAVINLGGAKPADIKLLATLARDRVKQLLGVELELAIHPVGRAR